MGDFFSLRPIDAQCVGNMKRQLEIVTLLKLYTQYQGRARESKDVRKCNNSVHLQLKMRTDTKQKS